MERALYFAYGSNLDPRQMRARCPGADVAGRAVLANHTLAFGGFSRRWGGAVATVLRARRGGHVEGLLYLLPRTDLLALDGFEGCPYFYRRRTLLVADEHGRDRRAQVYLLPGDGFVPWAPQAGYLRVLRRGYKRLGFDLGSLAAAAEAAR